jgi:hypothetical protein
MGDVVFYVQNVRETNGRKTKMNRDFHYAPWILSGAIIGAALALLATPTCGKETRRRLTRWARGTQESRPNLSLVSTSTAFESLSDDFYTDADIRLAEVVNG